MSELAIVDQPLTLKALQNMLAGSTLPDRYEYVGDAIATIKVGAEIGLPPMTSLMELYVVNGSVGMSGKAMQSLVMRAGHMIVMTEMSETRGAVKAMRRDNLTGQLLNAGEFEFTIEDAERAGLAGKNTYESYPKDMLLWKAVARAVRFVFPDVIMGYLPSEIGFDVEEEKSPIDGAFDDTYRGEELEMFDEEGNPSFASDTSSDDVIEADEVAEMLDGEVVE